MIEPNKKHIVTWNGKDYIEYLKYKDSKRPDFSEVTKIFKRNREVVFCLFIAGILALIATGIHDSLRPDVTIVFDWVKVMISVFIVGLSIGLMVHGIALVRR